MLTYSQGHRLEEQRNQVSGYIESRTYRTSYQTQNIMLDVGGLIRGRDVKDVLVRKLNPTNTDKDPHSTATLSTQDLKDIASNPEVV